MVVMMTKVMTRTRMRMNNSFLAAFLFVGDQALELTISRVQSF